MRVDDNHTVDVSVEDVLTDLDVVIIVDDDGSGALLRDWLSAISTRFATTVEDAYATIDSSAAVVIVFDTMINESLKEFHRDILARRPECQFIALVSDDTQTDLDEYDEQLTGPVSKQTLQETVQRRLAYSAYWTLLHEYYTRNARAITLRHDSTKEEMTDSMLTRLAQLRERLQILYAVLPVDDIREITRSIDQRKEYLNQPTKEPYETPSSKYAAKKCPACGLAWGTNHGNELGRGFEELGAGVRKCRKCNEIVHEPNATYKHVT